MPRALRATLIRPRNCARAPFPVNVERELQMPQSTTLPTFTEEGGRRPEGGGAQRPLRKRDRLHANFCGSF